MSHGLTFVCFSLDTIINLEINKPSSLFQFVDLPTRIGLLLTVSKFCIVNEKMFVTCSSEGTKTVAKDNKTHLNIKGSVIRQIPSVQKKCGQADRGFVSTQVAF
jgi:hypothetical protein